MNIPNLVMIHKPYLKKMSMELGKVPTKRRFYSENCHFSRPDYPLKNMLLVEN